VIGQPHRLLARFDDGHVELECRTEWLAAGLRNRLGHFMAAGANTPVLLRVVVDELQASWIEIRDSTGRCERGSFDVVAHYARKWVTSAFVAAQPSLLWVHAAAASVDGSAILLAGAAGAGKSSVLVQLLERSWCLLADDVVAVRPDRREALPLPFNPEVRAKPRELDEDWRVFLEQPKALAPVRAEQIASRPMAIAAIVFPDYSSDVHRPVLAPLTVVAAAQALATQCLHDGTSKSRTIADVFALARHVPGYRLRFRDPAAAASELAGRWSPGLRAV
jgi:hypothetical protein